MKVLVDTHALLWWMGGDRRLSNQARVILENSANERIVSVASLWELAIKISMARPPAYGLTVGLVEEQLRAQDFIQLPLRIDALVRVEKLPWLHRDPFDRMLIGQALSENIPLLTSDTQIQRYPVQTVW